MESKAIFRRVRLGALALACQSILVFQPGVIEAGMFDWFKDKVRSIDPFSVSPTGQTKGSRADEALRSFKTRPIERVRPLESRSVPVPAPAPLAIPHSENGAYTEAPPDSGAETLQAWRREYAEMATLMQRKLGNFPLSGADRSLAEESSWVNERFFQLSLQASTKMERLVSALNAELEELHLGVTVRADSTHLETLSTRAASLQKRLEASRIILAHILEQFQELEKYCAYSQGQLTTLPATGINLLDRFIQDFGTGRARIQNGITTLGGLFSGERNQVEAALSGITRTQKMIRASLCETNAPFLRALAFHRIPAKYQDGIRRSVGSLVALAKQAQVKNHLAAEIGNSALLEARVALRQEREYYQREMAAFRGNSSETGNLLRHLGQKVSLIQSARQSAAQKMAVQRRRTNDSLKKLARVPESALRNESISIPSWMFRPTPQRPDERIEIARQAPSREDPPVDRFPASTHPENDQFIDLLPDEGLTAPVVLDEKRIAERELALLKKLEEPPAWAASKPPPPLAPESPGAGIPALPDSAAEDPLKDFQLPSEAAIDLSLEDPRVLLKPGEDFLDILSRDLPMD